jgi:hypothetical protein
MGSAIRTLGSRCRARRVMDSEPPRDGLRGRRSAVQALRWQVWEGPWLRSFRNAPHDGRGDKIRAARRDGLAAADAARRAHHRAARSVQP